MTLRILCVQTNFAAWNEALKLRDYDKAASLYSTSDLTFLPTVSPEFIRDSHGTRRYFKDFVQRLPIGQITSDAVQSFNSDTYLHTGMYTFMTGPEDNRQPVQARFSYMWRLFNGKWKIIHHHSSEVPGKNTKAPANVDLYPVAQASPDKSLPLKSNIDVLSFALELCPCTVKLGIAKQKVQLRSTRFAYVVNTWPGKLQNLE